MLCYTQTHHTDTHARMKLQYTQHMTYDDFLASQIYCIIRDATWKFHSLQFVSSALNTHCKVLSFHFILLTHSWKNAQTLDSCRTQTTYKYTSIWNIYNEIQKLHCMLYICVRCIMLDETKNARENLLLFFEHASVRECFFAVCFSKWNFFLQLLLLLILCVCFSKGIVL